MFYNEKKILLMEELGENKEHESETGSIVNAPFYIPYKIDSKIIGNHHFEVSISVQLPNLSTSFYSDTFILKFHNFKIQRKLMLQNLKITSFKSLLKI